MNIITTMIMNTITSPVILGIVYYLLVLPYGAVLRLLGKDPLFRRWDPAAVTYRSVSIKPAPSHMDRPF